MPDPIPKHLSDKSQWEVEDFVNFARTGELPINPAYTSARNEALEDAGLEPDQDDTDVPIEEMSVAQHVKRKDSAG